MSPTPEATEETGPPPIGTLLIALLGPGLALTLALPGSVRLDRTQRLALALPVLSRDGSQRTVIRLHCGLETTEDLVSDVLSAL